MGETMDIRLYYEEAGDKEPLILLHGNGEDGSYFKHQVDYFSKDYRVIAIDTRGHGKSPRGEKPFTIGQFAEDLNGFMEEQGIKKAHLLGFSDGGNIALAFALKYPGKVDSLILNGANLCPSGVKESVQIPIVIGYKLTSFLGRFSQGARQKAEMLGLMTTQPDIRPRQLKDLKVRTLVIVGENDMIKDSHSALICESLPDARLVRIKGDHFIAAKNPEEFNRAVSRFLRKCDSID